MNWQPISRLPLFRHRLIQMFRNTEIQLRLIQEAAANHYILDQRLIYQAQILYWKQLKTLLLYEKHCQHWQEKVLDVDQQEQITEFLENTIAMRQTSVITLKLLMSNSSKKRS